MACKCIKLAEGLLLGILALLFIFHICILFGLFPADMVWGGQLEADSPDVAAYEIAALVILIIFTGIVLMRTRFPADTIAGKAGRIGIWVVICYFGLGSVGNLSSENAIENWLFFPLSVLLVFLGVRIALNKEDKKRQEEELHE